MALRGEVDVFDEDVFRRFSVPEHVIQKPPEPEILVGEGVMGDYFRNQPQFWMDF
jgi:hypothetical protein